MMMTRQPFWSRPCHTYQNRVSQLLSSLSLGPHQPPLEQRFVTDKQVLLPYYSPYQEIDRNSEVRFQNDLIVLERKAIQSEPFHV